MGSHRPVAAKHIRTYILENEAKLYFKKWYVPNDMIYSRVDDCTRQLAGQLKRESYILFSVTRLNQPRLRGVFGGYEKLDVDKLTSIGFLGLVF